MLKTSLRSHLGHFYRNLQSVRFKYNNTPSVSYFVLIGSSSLIRNECMFYDQSLPTTRPTFRGTYDELGNENDDGRINLYQQ